MYDVRCTTEALGSAHVRFSMYDVQHARRRQVRMDSADALPGG